MLKISVRGQYALMTMEILAEQNDSGYIPMKRIAHRQNVSVKYLEQILIQLTKAGLVEGLRGLNGGYRLIKESSQYTAGEILRAVEGDLSPRAAGNEKTVKMPGDESFWTDFEVSINSFVDSVTLKQLAEKNIDSNSYMFYI